MRVDDRQSLAMALGMALVRALGEPVEIQRLERLSGGASRETWSFDALDRAGRRHALILRRDFPDGGTQNPDVLAGRPDALDRSGEYALLQRLHAAGAPVPRPVAEPSGIDGLANCYVMERVEGEGRPRVIIRSDELVDVRARLAADLGSALATFHAFAEEDLPPLPRRPIETKLEIVRELLDRAGRPRPALELALRWCRERAPRTTELRLVHGDFRTSNYIVGSEGLRAVFDWEFAHLGDPVADLGFVCVRSWRFGADEREVTGVGDREDLYTAYAAAGGRAVDPSTVRFWEVMSTLYAGAVFLLRGMHHVTGVQRSVEGAAIGRRVAEIEYDLLGLLD